MSVAFWDRKMIYCYIDASGAHCRENTHFLPLNIREGHTTQGVNWEESKEGKQESQCHKRELSLISPPPLPVFPLGSACSLPTLGL